ncbi:hypothetical protein JX265_009178 [Neoarthrinium moseri]|uniref:Uncharacterized protein n=1 Tax=Neoarthrinium moseri TaxID=1658444 RepID=A0A9P9WGP5_9PEZI|nr:hypothetical protein JX265_009178 [Neoarthrinium moseri]
MPGEEMEISTDFGHHGPGEDIDIDLDFASGQHDEDLELGDYDQADEFQHFNSDNRDELMAEGDDASYGMIDADDITYNETATAANDYDIDIGGADDQSWPMDDSITVDAADTATDMVKSTNLSADDSLDQLQGNDASLLEHDYVTEESVSSIPVQQPEDHVQIGDNAVSPVLVEHDTESKVHVDGIVSHDFGIPSSEGDQKQPPQPEDLQAQQEAPQQDESDVVQFEQLDGAENEEQEGDADAAGVDDSYQHGDPTTEVFPDPEPEVEYDPNQEGEDASSERHGSQSHSQHEPDHDAPEEGTSVIANDPEGAEGTDNDTADAYQLGESSLEHTNEQNSDGPGGPKESDISSVPQSDTHISAPNEEIALQDQDQDKDQDKAGRWDDDAEDAATIARRHQMIVRYGESEYRLFAASPDEDPSEYFFNDTAALELPLGEFLSGIRNVISEEVSPLDELVMHVDGLGLEFSESMTNQFLGAYTFGHIITLYDSLLKNDATEGAIESPELYMHLMVRPSCLQRLLALQVQASSGKSLTDVAVYRDTTPVDDDKASEHEELAVTPDYTQEDELYEEDDEASEHHGSQDHGGNGDDEPESDPNEEQGSHEEPDPGVAEETGQEAADNAVNGVDQENAGDNVLDYDNIDLSPSKHGNAPHSFSSSPPYDCYGSVDCDCDTCFVQRIEDEYSPRSASCPTQIDVLPANRASTKTTLLQVPKGKDRGQFFDMPIQFELSQANSRQPQDFDEYHGDSSTANRDSTNVETKAEDTTTSNAQEHDDPPSQSTSATATLADDGQDEIDYDENDNDISGTASTHDPVPEPAAKLMVPVDEEITWESENEEARIDVSVTSQPSGQVSTTPGKRTRAESEALAISGDRKDVKRQRS